MHPPTAITVRPLVFLVEALGALRMSQHGTWLLPSSLALPLITSCVLKAVRGVIPCIVGLVRRILLLVSARPAFCSGIGHDRVCSGQLSKVFFFRAFRYFLLLDVIDGGSLKDGASVQFCRNQRHEGCHDEDEGSKQATPCDNYREFGGSWISAILASATSGKCFDRARAFARVRPRS
jgi:hypothetical protein